MLDEILKDPRYDFPVWILIPLLVFAFYIEYKDKLFLNEVFSLSRELKRVRMKAIRRDLHYKTGVLIGVTHHKEPVFIPDDAKHVFVCGTTGSGKTVALSNFIKRAIDRDYGLLIVDGKGDIGRNSILDITKRLSQGRKKLYVINLTRPVSSDIYNPFQNATPTMVKDMLINMTDWSEEHYKLNCERYLQRLVFLLHKAGKKLSFQSIVEQMPISRFSKLSADLAKAGTIAKEEHIINLELANTSGKIAESASARFSTLLESEIGHIFNENGIDIATALQEKAIILFILNPLIFPEMTPLLGRLLLIDSKKAVNTMFETDARTFFIYDEISTYASTAFLDLVNKSRSANVTCVLASQSLSDLETVSEHYKEQVIENCNNYIVLRQNSSVNAENWANILGTHPGLEPTFQIQQTNFDVLETDFGSLRRVRKYLYHPDAIKSSRTGEAVFMSKDDGFHSQILINKPY